MRHLNLFLVSSQVSLMKWGVGLSGAAEDGAHDKVVFMQLARSDVQVLIQYGFIRGSHVMSLEEDSLLLEPLAG